MCVHTTIAKILVCETINRLLIFFSDMLAWWKINVNWLLLCINYYFPCTGHTMVSYILPVYILVLPVYILFTSPVVSGSAFTVNKGLGLLANSGEVLIAKNSRHDRIGVSILANFSESATKTLLTTILSEVNNFENIPGIKEDPNRKKTVKKLIKKSSVTINAMAGLAEDLSKIKDTSRPSRDRGYKCSLIIPSLNEDLFTEVKTEIDEIIAVTPMTATKTEIDSSNQIYQNILSALYTILDILMDIRRGQNECLQIVTGLMSGEMPEELTPLLEAYSCTPTGNLENLQILACQKEQHGLFCEIESVTFTKTETYTRLVAINYDGVQLTAENKDQIFVADPDEKLGYLNCKELDLRRWEYTGEEKPPITDLSCEFNVLTTECANSLETDNYAQILVHCNFSFVVPDIVTPTEKGVLIMGTQDISIAEKIGSDQNSVNIPSRRPVLISSPNTVVIEIGSSSITYSHYKAVTERKILYTYLPGEFIKSLQGKAMWSLIQNDLGYKEYTLLSTLLVLVLLIPITGALCYSRVKHSQFCQRIRDSRARKIIKGVNKVRDNYQENKRFIRQNK